MVETDGLENRCTLTGTGGSNPSPSAIISERSFGSLAQDFGWPTPTLRRIPTTMKDYYLANFFAP